MNITTTLKAFVLAIILTAGLSFLHAAWNEPTATPPSNNTPPPINEGTTDQVKEAGLSLDALAVFGDGYFSGDVGLGDATPDAKLDIAGELIVGNTSLSCNSGAEGGIRYNTADKKLEYCDGSSWNAIATVAPAEEPIVLVNGNHTGDDCTNAGGNTTSIGGGNYICKFTGSSCPSGWNQYNNWSTTASNTCTGSSEQAEGRTCEGTSCTTGLHAFSDTGTESCTFQYGKAYPEEGGWECSLYEPKTCLAIVTEVGCY